MGEIVREVRIAGFPRRVVARATDAVIGLCLTFPVQHFLVPEGFATQSPALLVVGWVAIYALYVWLLASRGISPGLAVWGLWVVTDTGDRLGYFRAVRRNLPTLLLFTHTISSDLMAYAAIPESEFPTGFFEMFAVRAQHGLNIVFRELRGDELYAIFTVFDVAVIGLNSRRKAIIDFVASCVVSETR